MSAQPFISQELVMFLDNVQDWEQVLDKMARRLLEAGYVKGSYISAVIEREKVFPTGLPTRDVAVAIPHTDAEHVIRPAIAVGRLAQPVRFMAMGSRTDTVGVRLVFMLAVKEPQAQVSVLQKLMEVIQTPELLTSLVNAADSEDVVELLISNLGGPKWVSAC